MEHNQKLFVSSLWVLIHNQSGSHSFPPVETVCSSDSLENVLVQNGKYKACIFGIYYQMMALKVVPRMFCGQYWYSPGVISLQWPITIP